MPWGKKKKQGGSISRKAIVEIRVNSHSLVKLMNVECDWYQNPHWHNSRHRHHGHHFLFQNRSSAIKNRFLIQFNTKKYWFSIPWVGVEPALVCTKVKQFPSSSSRYNLGRFRAASPPFSLLLSHEDVPKVIRFSMRHYPPTVHRHLTSLPAQP